MDYINHITFAERILNCCQLDSRASAFANVPSFVKRGNFYNSMFTHALSYIPDMLEVACDVLSKFREQNEDEKATRNVLAPTLKSLEEQIRNSKNHMQIYYYKKHLLFYNQILNSMGQTKDQFKNLTGEDTLPSSQFYDEQKTALFLSFLSYIYFDLWVNPRQLFFPKSSVCSGSWDLWVEVDYFKLAENFVNPEAKEFHSNIYQELIWKETLNPFSMVKCMIICMGEKGSPPIPYSIIEWNIRIFLRYLGVNEYERGDAEISFLKKLDLQLDGAIRDNYKKL